MDLVEVFTDTQQFYRENALLDRAVKRSIKGTRYYGPDEYPEIRTKPVKAGHISVTGDKTFESALAWHEARPDDRIAVHNFASPTHPGGGVKNGASAQEESLCRCSTLYPVLNQQAMWDRYYLVNRSARNPMGTDAIIYTPDIQIIKTDDGQYRRLSDAQFVPVDVITCAAPNLNPNAYMYRSQTAYRAPGREQQMAVHLKRANHILAVAASHNVDILILGAFGCGAFRNDPFAVAQAYKAALKTYRGYFSEIEFAVYCRRFDASNYDVFKSVLDGK